jgi:hypothetical protein
LVTVLEQTGGLQLDSVNVVDRAHYLTLWSRFGSYERGELDRWIYGERLGYEYWGHQASILPISHLPLGRRWMRQFPPRRWTKLAWWRVYQSSAASKRRVLARLRREGPLESGDFERREDEEAAQLDAGWGALTKEDRRSLKLLWYAGRVAVSERRHFRCVYDLAERVYPEVGIASTRELEDSWLLRGLMANGVASERHLANYLTAPELSAAERRRVIARNLACGRILEVRVADLPGAYWARPEDLETAADAPEPQGTTLIGPFDSLLWQRQRAADLLDFHYRVEIYVPAPQRRFGYYVMPILHRGRLVGRLDPKLHRDRGTVEVRALSTEPGFVIDRAFRRGLEAALESLAAFLGAVRIDLPPGRRPPGRRAIAQSGRPRAATVGGGSETIEG